MKGWKTCPSCKNLISGPQTKVCPVPGCGHYFEIEYSDQSVRAQKILTYPDGYNIPLIPPLLVHAPSGECPNKLKANIIPSDEELVEWGTNIRQKMMDTKNQYLTNAALAYWAVACINHSVQFAPRGPEMTHVRGVINNIPDIVIREMETE